MKARRASEKWTPLALHMAAWLRFERKWAVREIAAHFDTTREEMSKQLRRARW